MSSKKVDIILGAVDKTAPAFRSVNSGIKSVIGNQAVMSTAATAAGAAIVAATVAAVAATAKMVQETAKLGDQLYDMSRKTGRAAEELAALDYVAKANGGNLESLALGLKKLSSNLLDAERGSDTARQTFADLGVEWDDGTGKMRAPLEVLFDMADAMTVIENEGRRSALAVDALGKSGDDLLPVLMAGSEALRAQMDEYRALGNQIDTGFVESSDRLLDSQLKVQTAWEQLKVAFSEPFISEASGTADELASSITGFVDVIVDNKGEIQEFASDLADIARGMIVISAMAVQGAAKLQRFENSLPGWLQGIPGQVLFGDLPNIMGKIGQMGGGTPSISDPYPGLGSDNDYLTPGQMAAIAAQQAAARRRASGNNGNMADATTVGPGDTPPAPLPWPPPWNGVAPGLGEWGSPAHRWLVSYYDMMNPDTSSDVADLLLDSPDTLQDDLDALADGYDDVESAGTQAFKAIEQAAGQAIANALMGVESLEDGMMGLFKMVLSMGIQAGVAEILPFSGGGEIPRAARGLTIPDGPRGMDSVLFRGMPGEHVLDLTLSRRLDRFLSASEAGPPAQISRAASAAVPVPLPMMFPTTRRDAMIIADTYDQGRREIERRYL